MKRLDVNQQITTLSDLEKVDAQKLLQQLIGNDIEGHIKQYPVKIAISIQLATDTGERIF